MNSFMKMALRLAEQSPHSRHQMAAVVVKGGAVLSSATNIGRWGHCAERRALSPHHDYRGSTVYVARANGRISKPCPKCQRLLHEAGIKAVVYINRDVEIEKVRL